MAIKIAGDTVIDDSKNWLGNPISPSFTATATGSIDNGDMVIVNSDGTVSVVSQSSQSTTIGTGVNFDKVGKLYTAMAYDANTQKVVIAYDDVGDFNKGKAVVGTVSGTSISFGTPVVFENSAVDWCSIVYDANTQKVAIFYSHTNNSSYGTAIVGTVSGTSISFGTAVVFESSTTDYITSTYDAASQKIVTIFRNSSLIGRAIVGTISGTSISFGTAVTFDSATVQYMSIAYDEQREKVVIAYTDVGNSSYGTAIVGTVSGTSISFGTAVVFRSSTANFCNIVYDTLQNKIVIAWNDPTLSQTRVIVGVTSGTSITFGSDITTMVSATTTWIASAYDAFAQRIVYTYRDAAGDLKYIIGQTSVDGLNSISFGTAGTVASAMNNTPSSVMYDTNAQKIVTGYRNTSDDGYAYVIQTGYDNSTLNRYNFVGISSASYTNGQTATIQTFGAIDDAQTGLIPGREYYVQTDGTLMLVPGSPEVLAGVAITSTKIIIKG